MKPHEPWVRLAQANVILGQNDVACQLLVSAADYEPWLWEVWRDLTVVSAKCEHFEKAAHAYLSTLKLNPVYDNEDILKRIVLSLTNGKMDKETHNRVSSAACAVLGKLIDIYPRNTNFWSLLGLAIASTLDPTPETRNIAVKTIIKAIEIVESPYNKWYNHDSQIFPTLEASQLIVDCLVTAGFQLRRFKEGGDCYKMAAHYIDFITKKLEDHHSDFLTQSVRQIFLGHYNVLKNKSIRIKSLRS